MITYKVLTGSIPDGLRIGSSRGSLRLLGVCPLGPSHSPPTFGKSHNLGVVDEMVEIDIDLEVSSPASREILGGSVINGNIPRGVKLIGNRLVGTPAETMTKSPDSFLPEDEPTWVTREGNLANVGEHQVINLTLETVEDTHFSIAKGYLPLGLKLLPSGNIIGVTGNADGELELSRTDPVWETARGQIAVVNEHQSVSIPAFRAAPRGSASTVSFRLVSGHLPLGIKFYLNGTFAGTTGELIVGDTLVDDREDAKTKPALASAHFAGKVDTAFSSTLSYTTSQGRTLLHSEVIEGSLPWGVKLNGNTISGTPKSEGTFSFKIFIEDSAGMISATIPFTFEVTT